MQAIHSIQNAMINANARIQSGMVVDAANGHRGYHSNLIRSRGVSPVVQRPDLAGSTCFPSLPSDPSDSKQSQMRRESTGQERGTETHGLRGGRTWRLDARHQLPDTAWAMLVLNRSISG